VEVITENGWRRGRLNLGRGTIGNMDIVSCGRVFIETATNKWNSTTVLLGVLKSDNLEEKAVTIQVPVDR